MKTFGLCQNWMTGFLHTICSLGEVKHNQFCSFCETQRQVSGLLRSTLSRKPQLWLPFPSDARNRADEYFCASVHPGCQWCAQGSFPSISGEERTRCLCQDQARGGRVTFCQGGVAALVVLPLFPLGLLPGNQQGDFAWLVDFSWDAAGGQMSSGGLLRAFHQSGFL